VDLAAGMNVDASTLSRNLKPLIAAGWVTLEAGEDGRSRLVHATEAGREKRAEAQRRWRVAQEGVNATLGPRRVIALHALIDEAMRALDEPEGEA
jgi:DNA-binding MarR family transcriptional regulator